MNIELIARIIKYLVPHTEDNKVRQQKMDILSKLKKLTKYSIGMEYLIMEWIQKIYKIRLYVKTSDMHLLKRDIVEENLNAQLLDTVNKPAFKLDETLELLGLQHNPKDPTQMSDLLNEFATMISDILDIIFSDEEITAEDIALTLETLKANVKTTIFAKDLKKTAELYNLKGLTVADKYQNESRKIISEISRIDPSLTSSSSDTSTIENYEDCLIFESQAEDSKKLFSIDIEPFKHFTFTSNDIMVVAANIHCGKTRMMWYLMEQALTSPINPNRVGCITTETTKSEMKNGVEAVYYYDKFKMKNIPYARLREYDNITDEREKSVLDKYRKMMPNMKRSFYSLGSSVSYLNTISYENCKEELMEFIQTNNLDIVCIDHTRALTSTGEKVNGQFLNTEKLQLVHLSKVIDDIRKELKVMFILASHTDSTLSKSSIIKVDASNPNITAGATEIAQLASFVFFIQTDNELRGKDQVVITSVKNRGYSPVTGTYVLQRYGDASYHQFDENIQKFTIADEDPVNLID